MTAPTTAQQLMKDGIKAIKTGHRDHGAELLLQAVELDHTLLPAWLWLGLILPDLDDRLTAAENALTLDPNNPQAKTLLANLLLERNPPAEPVPIPEPQPEPEPATPASFTLLAREPNLLALKFACIYCATPLQPDQFNCPNCHHDVSYNRQPPRPGWLTWWSVVFLGLNALFAIVVVGLIWFITSQTTPALAQVLNLPGVRPALENLLSYPLDAVPSLLLPLLIVYAGILFAYLLLVAFTNDLGFNLWWLFLLPPAALLLFFLNRGWLGWQLIAAFLVLLFIVVSMIIQGNLRRQGVKTTLRLELNPHLRSPTSYHTAAQTYLADHKIALAIRHWEAAINLDPSNPDYYAFCAQAYAQLDLWGHAAAHIRRALKIRPNNARLEALLEKYEAAAQQRLAEYH